MTNAWLLLLLLSLFVNVCHQSNLQCWKCEITRESHDEPGTFIDACQAQFDFSEHSLDDCDGKCWKSVDLLDRKHLSIGNSSRQRLEIKDKAISNLRSSRRCFSSDQLLQAAALGINIEDGCRQIRRKNETDKEICFCSDQDLCNRMFRIYMNDLLLLVVLYFVFIFGK